MNTCRVAELQDPPPYAMTMNERPSYPLVEHRRLSALSFTGVPLRAWDAVGARVPQPLPPAPPPTPSPSQLEPPSGGVPNTTTWGSRVHAFCRETSLHSLQYVTDTQRNGLERIFWLSMFALSVSACFPSVWEVWRKWRDESMVVVLQQSAMPVWKVPFPELTICNEIGVRYAALDPELIQGDAALRTLRPSELRASSLFCHNSSLDDDSARFISQEELYNFIRLGHVPCESFMSSCAFNGNPIDCCKVFQPRFSEFGLCFSFNALPYYNLFTDQMAPGVGKEDDEAPDNMIWSPESGYVKSWFPRQPVPMRVLGDGSRYGLTVMLKRNRSEAHPSCSSPNAGFKVAVTTPADVPPNTGDFLRLPMGRDTSLLLTPSLVLTWESMRSVLPRIRTCFFHTERSLRFFRFYTQKNCYLECLANRSLDSCGCVALHMPRLANTSICLGKTERKCVKDVNERMYQERADGVLRSTYRADDEPPTSEVNPCDCLPACAALDYNMETFTGDLMSKDEDTSVVHIFFKRYDFFPLVRKKQYDALDFISNCGGLLGLFLGFSLLSGVEVLYFLLLLPLLKGGRSLFRRRPYWRRNSKAPTPPVQETIKQ